MTCPQMAGQYQRPEILGPPVPSGLCAWNGVRVAACGEAKRLPTGLDQYPQA
ncbi:MAG: hypothetical protein Q9204_002907 [Flavoplaca sp. TL-2023a]